MGTADGAAEPCQRGGSVVIARINPTHLALVAAVVLGCLFDNWFRVSWLGIGASLFTGLALGALLVLAVIQRVPLTRLNLWVCALIGWLALVPALRDAPFLVGLDVVTLVGLSVLAADAVTGRPLHTLAPVAYLGVLASVAGSMLVRAAAPVGALAAAALRWLPARGRAAPVVRGLALSAPFLLVFTGLLGSADVVFGSYVERILRLELPVNLSALLDHGIVTLVAAWLLAGWLLHAIRPRGLRVAADSPGLALGATLPPFGETGARYATPADADESAPQASPSGTATASVGPLGFTEGVTLLGTVDLLFAAFLLVQFTYLFGGRETMQVAGLTYSEYARRGFFELLAVAAIALPLVVCLEWLTRRATHIERRTFQGVAGAMVLFTIAILGSAMVRMVLYEEACHSNSAIHSPGYRAAPAAHLTRRPPRCGPARPWAPPRACRRAGRVATVARAAGARRRPQARG
jgi:hypothetical protein